MQWREWNERLAGPAGPIAVIAAGVVILAGLYALPPWLDQRYAEEHQYDRELSRILEQTQAAHEHIESLRTLKGSDLAQLRAGISGHAQTQKSLFESGLSMQEERRLLEKQLEIMTTTLLINPSLQRIFSVAASPSIIGRLRSMRIMSGRSRSATSRATAPFSASTTR